MSVNTFGHLFRFTTWGESHGPALGATVDGCPPGVALDESKLQRWLDKRRPGQNKNTTQRQEADAVRTPHFQDPAPSSACNAPSTRACQPARPLPPLDAPQSNAPGPR